MAMRITIQVTCDTPEDAKDAINRLTRPKTWADNVELSTQLNAGRETGANTDSGKKVDNDEVRHSSHPTTRTTQTGSSANGAEQSGDKNGVTGAPRPNISPGWVACQKIGAETKEELLKELPGRDNDAAHIGKKIKRNAEATKALIQLLWDRDLIKWDGKEFYV